MTPDRDQTRPDRNLGMELVRATEAAAIRAAQHVGRGDKNAADGAAVDAMRSYLSTVRFDGLVVIGEGEKDHAPMLYNGERVGDGTGSRYDIAVDPIDGTSLAAAGRPGALSVLAVSERGTMFDPSSTFYMRKIVAGAEARGVIDIRGSVADNIRELARAKGKKVADVCVAVLDRPRHEELIDEIRHSGASTRLLLDGDVAGAIDAASNDSRVDLCIGIGGTPEGVIAATAVKALGGVMQTVPHPLDDGERAAMSRTGLAEATVLSADDLVRSDDAVFVATGVTNGDLLRGVDLSPRRIKTESIVLRARSGTLRRIRSEHLASRWGLL